MADTLAEMLAKASAAKAAKGKLQPPAPRTRPGRPDEQPQPSAASPASNQPNQNNNTNVNGAQQSQSAKPAAAQPAPTMGAITASVKPTVPPATQAKDFLFGSGLTKRDATRAQNAIVNPLAKLLNAKAAPQAAKPTPAAPAPAIVPVAKAPEPAPVEEAEPVEKYDEHKWTPAATAEPEPVIPTPQTIATVPNFAKAINTLAANEGKAPVVSDNYALLDEYQKTALDGLREQQYACLIGAAGTGKTFVTKTLAEELEQTTALIDLNKYRADEDADPGEEPDWNVAIAFCAFTGKAVEQMKKALPAKYHKMCDTIHGTLQFMPEREMVTGDDGMPKVIVRFYPTYTAMRKLPYKVIVIDEGSMVPCALWNQLMDACTPDVRIIIIGDINQLPPVTGRSVLGYAMTKWPVYALEKLHRNAGVIAQNAHAILNGFIPKSVPGTFDLVPINGGSTDAYNTVIKATMHLTAKGQFNAEKDAIIVPQNVGPIGQTEINQRLVTFFNPEKKDAHGVVTNKRHAILAGKTQYAFAVGDKVMVTKNNRDKGLTNGMTGIITEININGNFNDARAAGMHMNADARDFEMSDTSFALEDMAAIVDETEGGKDKEENQRQASHITTVHFSNGAVSSFATAGAYKTILHAYAFTCHKSQGSEFPTILILVHSANSRMLCREWLYTAVTRAQVRDIILYNDRGLQMALKTQRITGRTIKEKIEAFIRWEKESVQNDDGTLPVLPDPRKYVIKSHVELHSGE